MTRHLPPQVGHFFQDLPDAREGECFDTLLTRPGCRIERIVSQGQASPPGFWYEQAEDEWVLLLAGSATLRFESQGESQLVELVPGDHCLIPVGLRHRVESTDAAQTTIWLAVHLTPC